MPAAAATAAGPPDAAATLLATLRLPEAGGGQHHQDRRQGDQDLVEARHSCWRESSIESFERVFRQSFRDGVWVSNVVHMRSRV